MCKSTWLFCHCCWRATKKTVNFVCPSGNFCLVDDVTPVECWWRRCEKCFGKCPLFEDCNANLRVSASFFVSKYSEQPKFLTLEAAAESAVEGYHLSPVLPAGRWKFKKRNGFPVLVLSTSLFRKFPI